jgi:pimeloyl-ACP methyl ester carboxylesterase
MSNGLLVILMPVITVNNMRLYYKEQGEAHQYALVFIHGLGCSLKYWACVFDAEELANYRIIALDLPGFGMSEKPDTYDYSLFSQTDIVFAFTQSLNIQDCTLIGHSMGGSIAILLAFKHPELVKQLLVIEPNLRASDAHLSQDIIQRSESTFVSQYEEFRHTAAATVQDWFVNFHRTDIEGYISELLKTTPISMYRSALSLIKVTTDDTLLTQFQQLALQKYFLIGGETMKKQGIPSSFQNGNVHTVIVPGVGHMMMIDNPPLFNKTLASVLR